MEPKREFLKCGRTAPAPDEAESRAAIKHPPPPPPGALYPHHHRPNMADSPPRPPNYNSRHAPRGHVTHTPPARRRRRAGLHFPACPAAQLSLHYRGGKGKMAGGNSTASFRLGRVCRVAIGCCPPRRGRGFRRKFEGGCRALLPVVAEGEEKEPEGRRGGPVRPPSASHPP